MKKLKNTPKRIIFKITYDLYVKFEPGVIFKCGNHS